MRNTTAIMRCAALLAVGLFSGAPAEAAAEAKANVAKGRYYFRQTCRNCHGTGSKIAELTPMAKTMAQWQRYFKKGKHTEDEQLSDVLSEEQLRDVEKFLVSHAADSLQPMTCGR